MKTERVEFTAIHEDYNVYKVENGQILKVKAEVADIINKIEDSGTPKSQVKTQLSSIVLTPEGIDTTGLEEAELVTEKDQTKELKFEIIKDGVVNIYETKKSLILVGIKVEKIFATNKKNKLNEPILQFTSLAALSSVKKPDFESKNNLIIEQSKTEPDGF